MMATDYVRSFSLHVLLAALPLCSKYEIDLNIRMNPVSNRQTTSSLLHSCGTRIIIAVVE